MRFTLLAAPVLIASTAMGALLVKYGGNDPDTVWKTTCGQILLEPKGCGLNTKGDEVGKWYGYWEPVPGSTTEGRGWCICPIGVKKGVSYALKVADELHWDVIEGEGVTKKKTELKSKAPQSLIVNFQGYKAVYENTPRPNLEGGPVPWGEPVVIELWNSACQEAVKIPENDPRGFIEAPIGFQKLPYWTAKVECHYKGADFARAALDRLKDFGWKLDSSDPSYVKGKQRLP